MGWLDETERRLDDRLAALERRLDERLAGTGAEGRAAAAAGGARAARPEGAEGAGKAARTGGMPVERVFAEYLTPSEAELVQLFEFTRNSEHVRSNALYARILGATEFVYEPGDDELNAFATIRPGEGGAEMAPLILFKGGAARFGRVAALAVAAMRGGDREAGARFLGRIGECGLNGIGGEWAVRMVAGAGLGAVLGDDQALAVAKSVSAGMFLGILAHEAGHLSLGHLYGRSGPGNNDISRNQEREADSFASSVIAASPFGEYILGGMLLFLYALAQLEEGGRATTHPLSKERFANFVRANPDLAAEFGMKADG